MKYDEIYKYTNKRGLTRGVLTLFTLGKSSYVRYTKNGVEGGVRGGRRGACNPSKISRGNFQPSERKFLFFLVELFL